MTDKKERRVITGKVELRKNEQGEGRAVGYGAVFNSLSENLGGFREVIAPGAFEGVLDDDVRALFNHDSNLILGRNGAGTLALSVDEHGLRYEIDMPDTSYARDLSVSMERGDVTQSSFGFTVENDDWSEDEEGRTIRTITKFGRLFDVSPVTYPAYPEASVALRSLEKFNEEKVKAEDSIEAEARKRELDLLAGVFTPCK